MKKQKIGIFIFLLCLFTLSSCKEDNGKLTEIVDKHSLFKLINNSGVEVAIVSNARLFPDSLVLANGGVYEWVVSSPHIYGPMYVSIPPKIYFNKKIYVIYDDDYMPERNPGYGLNYDKIVLDKYDTYSYTFTPEDYQNALKQQ